jgi:hypothetical protein
MEFVVPWWDKQIWKIKGPPKGILFFWLILKGKVLTWDHLQRLGRHGLGVCVLCKGVEETIPHIFRSCPYTYQVWNEISV